MERGRDVGEKEGMWTEGRMKRREIIDLRRDGHLHISWDNGWIVGDFRAMMKRGTETGSSVAITVPPFFYLTCG